VPPILHHTKEELLRLNKDKLTILFIINGPLQICVNISDGWKTFWDDDTMTPYAVQGDKVITYDDERSIAEKVCFLIIASSKAALMSEMNNFYC
jgi:hypothetical protein